MKITSATFVRGATDNENLIRDKHPQIAFIGRSNVGKSSLINTLSGHKGLARSSSTPGRTQELNFFLINKAYYFVDLPGYGYARGKGETRDLIIERIGGYLFDADINQKKVVLIIDAKVGMTEMDKDMFFDLEKHNKDIVIVLNKIDKVNQSEKQKTVSAVKNFAGEHPIVLFSSDKKIGIKELNKLIF